MMQIKRRYKLIIVAILVLLLFCIGFIAGSMYYIVGLKFQNEINPLHAISILTPVIIAILISVYLDKDKEDTKVVRTIFTTRIFNLDETINELYDSIMINNVEYTKLTSFTKRISVAVNTLQDQYDEHYKTCPHTTEAIQLCKDIKDLSTNTNIMDGKKGKPDIKCVNNIVTYSDARTSELCTKIELLKDNLFKLQLHINTIYCK